MGLQEEIVNQHTLVVEQKLELMELLGLETRNRYTVTTEGGMVLAYAVEQRQPGALDLVARLFLGHWRTFDIHVFDRDRNLVFMAHHPFRWFFQRLEISSAARRPLGALVQYPALLSKRFDVEDATGTTRMTVASPLWRIWTFPFLKGERQVAVVTKRWRGLLEEGFTDTDRFVVEFEDSRLTGDERLLLLAAALFVDIQYFEERGGGD